MNSNLRWFFICTLIMWLFVVMLIFAAGVRAETVGLIWDANDPTDEVEFYTVYVNRHPTLDVDTNEARVDVDIPPGRCVSFFVTASRGDDESGPSNTVSKCTPAEEPEPEPEPTPEPEPEPEPPVIVNPPAPPSNNGGGCFISTIGG